MFLIRKGASILRLIAVKFKSAIKISKSANIISETANKIDEFANKMI
ncbi:hypothetical protein ACFWM3_04735 [Gottfriedia sp. NPDC058432]|nr:hypothetical protein [Bacillus sp. FJAT-25509]